MPRYISQHTLACLTRQGAVDLIRRVHAASQVKARRVLLNMQEGKMLIEFDAPGRDDHFLDAEPAPNVTGLGVL